MERGPRMLDSPLRRWRYIRRTLWSVLAALGLFYAIQWYLLICIDKGRRVNMEYLAEGIIRYSDKHSRFPVSLRELESGNSLPHRSEIYACPLQNGRFFLLPTIEFTNMQYEILFHET